MNRRLRLPQFPARYRLAFILVGLMMLAIPIAALADELIVDGDGLTPVAASAMNLGSVCVGSSTSSNALLAIRRTGQGQLNNVFSNNSTVSVTAGTPSSTAVSSNFVDNGITLPSGWTGAGNNTLSSDTATSKVTVTAQGSPGARSATILYTASGTRASDGDPLSRTTTLTINWSVIACDTTPPTITPNIAGTLGNNGWYTDDVTVSWSVTDPESTVTSQNGCGPTTINSDTAGQTLTCSATSAGGTANKSVTIKRDATAPTIGAGVPSPSANGNGWHNSDVTVGFSCGDAMSGPVSLSSSTTVSSEGANQSASGTCTDNAGNSASATASPINIDKSAPSVSASAAPAANANGWYNGNVTVSFSGTDALSGIASCDTAAVLSSEGAGQSATGACTDKAGNSGSATATGINIDKSAPTVYAVAMPAANANGWNNSNVTVGFSGSDAVSGIDSCDAPIVKSSEGANQSATGACTDLAGNSASANASPINIDKTAPTASAAAAPAANTNGWNNTDVTVTFTGDDALSGIASCDTAAVLSSEGAGQSASGACTDKAGNVSAIASATGINIDKTAPTASAAAAPAANTNGWNNTDVTVTFTGDDALSGLASCAAPIVKSSEGAGQSATGACSDLAGNSASATASPINIDKTAPTASATALPAPNGNGWNNTDVMVTFSGDDALSGLAGCAAPIVKSSEGAGQSAGGTCTDKAGNVSATASATGINIDKTAPTVGVNGAMPGMTYTTATRPTPTCDPATDALSGIAQSSATPAMSGSGASNANSVGSFTATCSATDKAGNSASKSVSYTVNHHWSGFLRPVDNLPIVNRAKAGSAIPVKFNLNGVSALSAVANIQSQPIACDTSLPTDTIDETVSAGSSSLSYDPVAQQFVYVWKSLSTWRGCRQLLVTLDDGSLAKVAYFNFVK